MLRPRCSRLDAQSARRPWSAMPQDLVFASLAKDKRITVNALCQNHLGTAFWRAVGFTDYSLTLEFDPRKFLNVPQ
jgi:hypothetical protein